MNIFTICRRGMALAALTTTAILSLSAQSPQKISIKLPSLPDVVFGDGPVSLTAIDASSLACLPDVLVDYSVDYSGNAYIDYDNNLCFTGAGPVTVVTRLINSDVEIANSERTLNVKKRPISVTINSATAETDDFMAPDIDVEFQNAPVEEQWNLEMYYNFHWDVEEFGPGVFPLTYNKEPNPNYDLKIHQPAGGAKLTVTVTPEKKDGKDDDEEMDADTPHEIYDLDTPRRKKPAPRVKKGPKQSAEPLITI